MDDEWLRDEQEARRPSNISGRQHLGRALRSSSGAIIIDQMDSLERSKSTRSRPKLVLKPLGHEPKRFRRVFASQPAEAYAWADCKHFGNLKWVEESLYPSLRYIDIELHNGQRIRVKRKAI